MSGAFWIRLGAVSAAVAVGLGAFGAHALKDRLTPERLDVFEVGVRYQMYHALALLACGLMAWFGRRVDLAGWSFAVGTLIFSGSLYALVLTERRWLGAITPIGGLAFLVGWLALAVAASSTNK